jgi:RNA polymerase sigma-70 factor (ECF subfamily)
MDLTALRDLSEDELLTLAQARDEAAFTELMRRSSSASFKLALSILRDRQDAEDEVQNSYWNAWRYVGQFRRGSKFSTWISRIVLNQCLMRLRKSRQVRFLYLDQGAADGDVAAMELPDRSSSPETEVFQDEMSAMLHTEIRRLPPLLRSVLVLRDLEEVAMEDVARRLGITLAAAKSRLLRARIELKRRLSRQDRTSQPTILPA